MIKTDVGLMKTSQSGFTSDYEVIGALEAVKKTILEGNYDMAIRENVGKFIST